MAPSELARLAGPLPSGPLRGRVLDWFAYQAAKTPQRLRKWVAGRPTRPHHEVLRRAVADVLERFGEPVCLETGCMRNAQEGTDSTKIIASALGGRGRFFSFEIDPAHIELCRQACGELNERICYVPGDAKENLRRLRRRGLLESVHLAFLDSADAAEEILSEFEAIEEAFVPGSLLVVDDAVRGVKARFLLPRLRRDAGWDTRLVYAGNGMLLGRKRADAAPA